MFQEIEQKASEIKLKKEEAIADAVAMRTKSKDEASAEANSIIGSAKDKAHNNIEQIRNEISEGLAGELSKVSSVVKEISDEIFEIAVK